MKAALVIWVDISPEDDALFNHWHSREHVQERVGCPGWLRGSRLGSVDTPGRYLLFYDAETPAAFDSEAYYARLRNPTELSRVLFPKFRNTSRTACAVERRVGDRRRQDAPGPVAAAAVRHALRGPVDHPLGRRVRLFALDLSMEKERHECLRGHIGLARVRILVRG